MMEPAATEVQRSSREDARGRILKAATRIFLRDGFARARVDMVAAAARISKLGIYEQFPTKAALFEAAVRHACHADFFSAAAIMDEADIRVALRHIGGRMFDRFLGPIQFGLTRANIVAASDFPALAAEIHSHQTLTSQGIGDYLQLWIDRGVLARQDALRVAVRFAGLCVEGSRYFLGALPPGEKERAATVGDAVELFLYGQQALVGGRSRSTSLSPIEAPRIPGNAALRLPADKLDRIVAIAADEFLAHGLRGANLDRIVAAVPVAKTTLYRQFGNKEGLFRYVARHAVRAVAEPDYMIGAEGGVEADVAALARRALDVHCTEESIRLHRLLIGEIDVVPDLARSFHEARVHRLGEALATVMARHRLAPPNGQMIRFFYVLATFSLRHLTTALPDAAQRARDSKETARLFLHGALQSHPR